MPRGYRTSPLGSVSIAGPLYSLHVLRVGYSRPQPDGSCRADGSVTLLRGGPLTVLVDTGGPWLRPQLPGLLGAHGVAPEDVTHVVVTHGHSDHAGNLNLFPEATLLVGFDLSRGEGLYLPHGLARGVPVELHPGHLRVVPTPGHTRAHVSLVALGTAVGTVAVAGDVFEHGEDEEEWQALSEEPEVQRKSREELVALAEVIVPGHGEPFRVVREWGERREEEEEDGEEGRWRCGGGEEEEEKKKEEEEGKKKKKEEEEEKKKKKNEDEEEGGTSGHGDDEEKKKKKKEEEEGGTWGCGDIKEEEKKKEKEEEEGGASGHGDNEEKEKKKKKKEEEEEGGTSGHGDNEEEAEKKKKKKEEEDEGGTWRCGDIEKEEDEEEGGTSGHGDNGEEEEKKKKKKEKEEEGGTSGHGDNEEEEKKKKMEEEEGGTWRCGDIEEEEEEEEGGTSGNGDNAQEEEEDEEEDVTCGHRDKAGAAGSLAGGTWGHGDTSGGGPEGREDIAGDMGTALGTSEGVAVIGRGPGQSHLSLARA